MVVANLDRGRVALVCIGVARVLVGCTVVVGGVVIMRMCSGGSSIEAVDVVVGVVVGDQVGVVGDVFGGDCYGVCGDLQYGHHSYCYYRKSRSKQHLRPAIA